MSYSYSQPAPKSLPFRCDVGARTSSVLKANQRRGLKTPGGPQTLFRLLINSQGTHSPNTGKSCEADTVLRHISY